MARERKTVLKTEIGESSQIRQRKKVKITQSVEEAGDPVAKENAMSGKKAKPRKPRKPGKVEIAERVAKILTYLEAEYPNATCSLYFQTPFQLLIATILSAQCTDKRVNEVTKELFKRYPDAWAFANAEISELEEMIRSTGFFRNKARNIINCAQALVAEHGGEVPQTLEELIPLSGVGRKTANVVLGDAFGVPGIVVDTHAKRLSQRLGLTREENPEKIESDLMKIIPEEKWTRFCHQLIAHGRAICVARSPKCEICSLVEDCDFGQSNE